MKYSTWLLALVVATPSLYAQVPNPLFVSTSSPEPYRNPQDYSLRLGLDLEGDGDVDLFEWRGAAVGRNLGAAFFSLATVSVVGDPGMPGDLSDDGIFRTQPGDWDGDGDQDLLVGRFPNEDVLLEYLGPGAGGAARYQWHTLVGSVNASFHAVLPVDLDLDGDVDAINTTYRHPRECLLPGTCFDSGAGQTMLFERTASLEFGATSPAILGFTTTDIADLNGDQLPDLIVVVSSSGVAWVENLGGMQFASPVFLGTDPTHPETTRVGVADLDLDGDIDLAVGETTGSRLFLNDGLGNFTPQGGLPPLTSLVGPPVTGFQVEDFDVDGNPDLLLTSGNAGCEVLLGDGAGGFTLHSSYPTSLATGVPIDVDRDGDLDRVVTIPSSFGQVGNTFLMENLAKDGLSVGEVEQFGEGSVGSGGIVATLGLAGRPAPGESVELRFTHGLGGAAAFVVLSPAATQLIDVPVPGVTIYVDPFLPISVLLPAFQLSNAGLGAGKGRQELPFFLFTGLAGAQLFAQGVALDPNAPGGLATTNLLRVKIGQ